MLLVDSSSIWNRMMAMNMVGIGKFKLAAHTNLIYAANWIKSLEFNNNDILGKYTWSFHWFMEVCLWFTKLSTMFYFYLFIWLFLIGIQKGRWAWICLHLYSHKNFVFLYFFYRKLGNACEYFCCCSSLPNLWATQTTQYEMKYVNRSVPKRLKNWTESLHDNETDTTDWECCECWVLHRAMSCLLKFSFNSTQIQMQSRERPL